MTTGHKAHLKGCSFKPVSRLDAATSAADRGSDDDDEDLEDKPLNSRLKRAAEVHQLPRCTLTQLRHRLGLDAQVATVKAEQSSKKKASGNNLSKIKELELRGLFSLSADAAK